MASTGKAACCVRRERQTSIAVVPSSSTSATSMSGAQSASRHRRIASAALVDGLPWEAAFGGMVLTFLAFAAVFLFAGRRTFRRHDDPCELRCYRSGTNIIRESRIWRNP